MKKLALLLIVITLFTVRSQAVAGKINSKANSSNFNAKINTFQAIPIKAVEYIKFIDAKVKEVIGSKTLFGSEKDTYIIEDASFTDSEMGVTFMTKMVTAGKTSVTYTFEFMPSEIDEISQINSNSESLFDQIKIHFFSKTALFTLNNPKSEIVETYKEYGLLNFLKLNLDNYRQIENILNKLKEIYQDEKNNNVDSLSEFMNMEDQFWASGIHSSKVYSLQKVFLTGCTLRFEYSLNDNNVLGYFYTVIPLTEIDAISINNNKPKTILLHSIKKGFQTFKLGIDDDYLIDSPIKEIPLFLDVINSKHLNGVVEILNSHIVECGGRKVKLKGEK